MTVKIICALTIILSCSYIGLRLSDAMHKRVRSLTMILAAVGHIEACISAVRMPLAEIYSDLAKKSGMTGEFFSKAVPGESWEKHLDILAGLSPQDKTVICDLSEKLGTYETERQLDEIKLAENLLSDALLKAKKDVAENSKVYRAMSFFTGVVIAVLLI